MTTPELIHIPYSPWSEKARWALEVRAIDHRARVYQPIIGEPELRFRTRRLRGIVSAPVMFTDDGPCLDSYGIARWASVHGSGPELFPAGAEAAIERWNDLSERGLRAGRTRSLGRVLEDRAALVELVPKPLRPVLGPLAPRVAALGVRRTLRKYGANRGDAGAELRAVLAELRAALPAPPYSVDAPPTLVPEHGLTYADIAMTQVLAFIRPPERGLRIGRANRAAFTDDELAVEAADLLAWRDAIYARYRG